MTKVNNQINVNNDFVNYLIDNAKIEYLTATSWQYSIQNDTCALSFSQDEQGKNHIDESVFKINGLWVDFLLTNNQIKRCFDKLNNTPYNGVEEKEIEVVGDLYDYFGVSHKNFY